MTGELHEISRVIGGLEQSSTRLTESFDKHCDDDERRHQENQAILRAIDARMATMNETIAPLIKTINAWKPIIESYQATRWKVAGMLTLGGLVLYGLGYVAQLVFAKAIGFFFLTRGGQ